MNLFVCESEFYFETSDDRLDLKWDRSYPRILNMQAENLQDKSFGVKAFGVHPNV